MGLLHALRFLGGSLALGITLVTAASAQPPPSLLTGNGALRARCLPVEPAALSCDFRLADPADVRGIQVSAGGVALAPATWESYPSPRSLTAVLLLVDSSGTSRQLHLGQGIQDLTTVLEAAPAHLRFGLASFDGELTATVPIGESRTVVRDAATRIAPTERPTELFRVALEALSVLAATPADRRALFLFSDGLAEDRAYFHQDVVAAAKARGITIVGFGYPRSPVQAVALQTLRRLSEDTGGTFLPADASGRVPREAVTTLFRSLDSGGTLRAGLAPALAAGVSGPTRVQLTVQTSRGIAEGYAQVELPAHAAPAGAHAAPAGTPASASAAGSSTPPSRSPSEAPAQTSAEAPGEPPLRPAPPAPIEPARRPTPAPAPAPRVVFDYRLALGALAAAVMILAWALRRRSPGRAQRRTGSEAPVGYLHFRDQPEREGFPVVGPRVRIGRQRDNDLVLGDASVSRHHAEIQVGNDGSLTLVDLDSLNGVFVNERQVKSAGLADGDSVEIGDVRFVFSERTSAPAEPRRAPGAMLEQTGIARASDLPTSLH